MYVKPRLHGQHACMQDSVTCTAERHADENSESAGLHLLKGHAVQDHLCARSNILHGDHIYAHAKPVQQLRPQLALLHNAPLSSDLCTAPMCLSYPWQCTDMSMHCTSPVHRRAMSARGQAQHSADKRRVRSTPEHSTGSDVKTRCRGPDVCGESSCRRLSCNREHAGALPAGCQSRS